MCHWVLRAPLRQDRPGREALLRGARQWSDLGLGTSLHRGRFGRGEFVRLRSLFSNEEKREAIHAHENARQWDG